MKTVLSSEEENKEPIYCNWHQDPEEGAAHPDERLINISTSKKEKKYITEFELKLAILYYLRNRGAGEAVQFMRELLEGYYWPPTVKD